MLYDNFDIIVGGKVLDMEYNWHIREFEAT